MQSAEVFANHAEHVEPRVDLPGVESFDRALRTTKAIGAKLRVLPKTQPYLALGVAAAAGTVAGLLVGARLARLVLLIAAGYAVHGISENGEPILKAGIDRLARAIGGS